VLVQALCGRAGGAVPAALLVAAHPDDETVGAGAHLGRLRHARFVYITDGAPLDGHDASRHGLSIDGYRALRRQERDAALSLCGIAASQAIDLGCPDQQAARRLPSLAMDLAELFLSHRPEAVVTHPYEGGHPDHDATAFAVHAAAALLRRDGAAVPSLVEMTSYHHATHGLQAEQFLPDAQADAGLATVHLDEEARRRKRALLACYASQRETLAQFPVEAERYRPAPRYDFTRPPHAGTLHYEHYAWGLTGVQFRRLAGDALVQLRLEGAL
jgi:LmbE family N-acetylglucosaminyl deacetylase